MNWAVRGNLRHLDRLLHADATVHGEDREDVEHRFSLQTDFWDRMFEVFLILGKEEGKCVVKQILERGQRIC